MAFDNSTLPVPYGLKFTEWAAVASEQLAQYGIPPAGSEADWQQWAGRFCDSGLPGVSAPRPEGFADWQQWASSLIGTIT